MILHGNLHRQFEDNTADAILRACDLAADDRLQRRGEDFAATLNVQQGDVMLYSIADEFTAGAGIC